MTLAWIALFLACAADVLSTVLALRSASLQERTPFVAWAIAKLGVIPGLAVSKIATLGPLVVLGLCWPSRPLAMVLLIAALFTGAVAANNVRLILRHGC